MTLIISTITVYTILKLTDPIFEGLCVEKARRIATDLTNRKSSEVLAKYNYQDTVKIIKSEDEKNSFYYGGCLYDWEIAMRTNMGGGLPISGFYEMKQEVYEIYRRQSVR